VIWYSSQNDISAREFVGEKNRGNLMLMTEGYWKIDSDVRLYFRVKQYPALAFKFHRQASYPKIFSDILQFLHKNSGEPLKLVHKYFFHIITHLSLTL
jgi:hypothetical protein